MKNPKIEAMELIDEKLKSKVVNNDDLIQTHRLDQRIDFQQMPTKVIFGENATKKLVKIVTKVLDTDFREYGVYFFGNTNEGFIYFDDFSSDFQLSNGIFKNGAVDCSENLHELDLKTEQRFTSTPYNAVMHFHTHPDHVYDKKGQPFNPASLLMSEQDLYNYGFHQLYLQPESNNSVIYLGGMLAKNNNHPEFNVVFYNPNDRCFYNLKDIYITDNEELIKIDNSFFNNPSLQEVNMNEKMKFKVLELIKKR